MKIKLVGGLCVLASAAFASSFTQCPAVGNDTLGCELLITVTAVNSSGAATAWNVATSSPDQGPFESDEDTLIGIVNSSSNVLKSIALSGSYLGKGIFAFDGDGACAGSGTTSAYSLTAPTLAQCGLAAYTTTDPFDYQSAGATFTGINANGTSGTVLLGGANGLAIGASTWFDLEGKLTAQTLTNTPEPFSLGLVGAGLAMLGCIRRSKRV